MMRMFKLRVVIGFVILSVSAMKSPAEELHDLDWYAHAVQDVISYYGEGRPQQEETPVIYFNDEPIPLEQLAEQLKNADAIVFNALDRGKTDGFAANVVQMLKLIGELGISDDMINLNLEYRADSAPADYDVINIAPDGALSFAGKPVELSDLSGLLSEGRKVGIEADRDQPPPSFSTILAVVKVVGRQNIHHIFNANSHQQILIKALIVRLKDNGEEDTYSNAAVTTMPGYHAAIRVVENRSGYKSLRFNEDPYEQEDLANNGVCMMIRPLLIDGYIRLSGVIVLRKSDGSEEAFKNGDIPMYSYSVSKSVIPFSFVLPPGMEKVEIPVAPIDGMKAVCRFSVQLVDG